MKKKWQQVAKTAPTDELRYIKMRRAFPFLMVGVIVAISVSVVLCVSIGQVNIPFGESLEILFDKLFGIESTSRAAYVDIVWEMRFPRALAALLAGIALSLCGTVMQATVQNPLADPYVIGISSGASLGATFVIMMGFGGASFLSGLSVSTASFLGALGAGFIVLIIANTGSRMTSAKLVLSGMVINMVCGTFTTLITYLNPSAEGMQTAAFWEMGSIAGAKWGKFGLLPIIVLVAAIFFIFQRRNLNAMMLGEEAAATLGINLAKMRTIYMAIASLLTGVIVARYGIIAYTGLIIPHISRGLVGTEHGRMLPFAMCLGALFMIWADILARTLMPNSELPLGLITSAVGAPMLLYIILRRGFSAGSKS